MMAAGECSARVSFNLLRITLHRRCEHHSEFRKFDRDKYLLYFLITELYTVWKLQFFSSKTSFGAKTKMVSYTHMAVERIYAAIAEIYSITLQFLTVKVMIFRTTKAHQSETEIN